MGTQERTLTQELPRCCRLVDAFRSTRSKSWSIKNLAHVIVDLLGGTPLRDMFSHVFVMLRLLRHTLRGHGCMAPSEIFDIFAGLDVHGDLKQLMQQSG